MFALRRCLPLAFFFLSFLAHSVAHAADTAAQVQQFSPQGELETVRQVTARFSTDMVRLGDPRVKNPFTVSCVAKGRGRWVDTRNWAYDFDADVPRNRSCTFTLVKDQRDVAGQPVSGRRSFAFNTSPLAEAPAEKAVAGEIAIDFFVPQGEAYPVRQVQVRFSEDMVRLGSGLMNPFGVGCAVRGKGRWVDTRNWVYDFDVDLPSGIACQFVAVKGLRGVSGKPLRAYAPLKFNTGGPRIMDARPYSEYEGIDENQVFLLKFDGDNDRNSLPRSSYCLAENIKEKIPLRFLAVEEARSFVDKLPQEYRDWWNSPDKRLRERRAVSCARQLPPGAKVQLVFAKGLLSATGVASSADQVLSFKVRPAFTAKFSCTRENARQACAPMTDMTLEFTDTVSAELLQGIRLEGAGQVRKPKGNAYDDEYGESDGVGSDEIVAGNVVTFPGPFPPEASFTLKIPANFKDESGRSLVNASRFPLPVKTANYPPLAKFAANFGIIEKAAGAVPLTLRNLEPGKGVTPEARLFTYKLPDSDIELLRWLGRFNKHQNNQSCYNCGRRDEAGNLLDPDPRSLSLLASIKGVNVQTLPRTLAAKEFEVIGLPVSTGAYVHEVESRYLGESLIANKAPMYVSALSIVTNLGVHLRHGPQGSLVWVTTLDKGQPVANADVAVLDCKGGSTVWRGKTDAQGLARFDAPRNFSDYAEGCMGRYAVIARSGADRSIVLPAWDEGIESWRFNVSGGWHESGNLIAHSILDRSLLRAGETLHMRHVVRETSLQSLTAPRNARYKKLFVRYDGGGQEYELPLNIGKDGNGDNEWKIPAAAKLGRYSILLEAGDREYALGSFRVEEFRLPVLKAQLQLPGGPQILPDRLPVDMQLQYINGGSYPKAAVTLRGQVSSTGTSFKDFEDYSFSYSRYRDDEEGGYEDGSYEDGGGSSPIALEEQALTLDERGGLRADSGKLPAITKVSQLRVEMEYRDPSGETHTSSASASLWPAAVIPGVKLPSWITLSGNAPQKVDIVTLGPDGKPRANIAIKASAELRSRQSHRRRTVGGFYAYESVQKKEALPVQCAGRSDSKGRLSCTVTPAVSGELVLNVEATDEKGRVMRSNASTWVSTGDRWWFDQGNDDRIDLLPEKKEYRAGDTMKLQVRMPFPEATALIGIERDGVIETFVQTIKSSNPVISLPVKADYAPNVYISALLVRGRNDAVAPTALIDLGKPAFKLGIAEVKVGWEAWRLGVNVRTDKPRYHPRDKAQVSVQVTPPAQQPLPAGTEVTLAAVDEALLELAGNDSWDVLTPMMASRSHDVDTATSQLQVVGKRHYGRKALPPGGGGGRGGGTRELFDTLIYWQARAKVDANGQAQFSVPLNDSLTGFRIVAVATSENRFGTGDTRMESFQDVSVLSGLPLVVRQGDQLDPGFTLRNSSDKAQTLKFTAELEGRGKLLEKTVTVAPGTSTVVAVPFTVPADVEKLDWLLSAEGQDASDRVKLSQKVLDPVPERVLQGTLLQLEKPTDIPVQKPADALPGGAIQVSGQARLSDSLDEVKRYFESYPYSCLEQKTSRAAGLQDRARWNEVMELLPVYLDDKGFAAFYPNTAGYPFLTAYILRVSKGLGWPVPEASRQRMLDGLVNYVEGRAGFEDWRLRELDDAHRRLEVLTLLAQYGRFKPAQLDALRIDPPRWTTSMLVNWFELLRASPSIPRRDERLAQAESLLRSRLTLQGSAYLLSEGEYSWWWLYDNDQATVARLMLATMDLPAWKEDEPRLLRGLLMRQREGHWDTTIANLWGGMALKRFSEVFERDAVMGRTELRLATQEKSLDWATAKPAAQRLDWPAKPDVLKLTQEGSGKPWITVQARARLPLKAPLSTGFKVVKIVEPVQRKTAGQWSVGDVVRVTLKLEAQGDIGWVAVDDPIPAGSTLLGRALGRDSSMAAETADAWTWATFAEFGADSYRAYYERIYKGEWEVRYTLRLNQSGEFRLPPTRVEAMYAPEMFGMTPNANWVVKP